MTERNKRRGGGREPTIAPGMNTRNPLEEKASEEEIRQGEFTEVTRLFLDRTPED
jgi:hypothetical protein